jgi:hypothetical protein
MTPGVTGAQASGDWLWPLTPRPAVVAGFDPPTMPYGPGHVGVDLLGWPGQLVTSVAEGTVAFAGQVAGVAVVSVQHGNERSTYQPVVATVARGQTVAAGQLIGTLSNAGGHCLPLTCLHLGRRLGETYLDPLELLGGGPVRLLPREGESLAHSRPGAWTSPGTGGLRLPPGAAGVGSPVGRLAVVGLQQGQRVGTGESTPGA